MPIADIVIQGTKEFQSIQIFSVPETLKKIQEGVSIYCGSTPPFVGNYLYATVHNPIWGNRIQTLNALKEYLENRGYETLIQE